MKMLTSIWKMEMDRDMVNGPSRREKAEPRCSQRPIPTKRTPERPRDQRAHIAGSRLKNEEVAVIYMKNSYTLTFLPPTPCSKTTFTMPTRDSGFKDSRETK